MADRLELARYLTRSDQQLAASSIIAHGELLAACGCEFIIAADTANMPDASALAARAPVAAELCEIPVQVTLSEAGPLSDLDIGQFGAYRFDADRATVWIRRPALQPAWQTEALHGPVLLHALAQREVFVLHASAARRPGGPLIAFTAESGVGKSTVARDAARLGWQRIGDDLLPIARRDGRIVALPHLSQPKLADSEQYAINAAPTVPLAALIQLARGPQARFERLAPRQAADLMLASTVATRVYARRSLATHLAFVANLVNEVTMNRVLVGRLTMADRPRDIAGAVAEALGIIEAICTESGPA